MIRFCLFLTLTIVLGATCFAQSADFKVGLAIRGGAAPELGDELAALLATHLLERDISIESTVIASEATLDELRLTAQSGDLDALVIITADQEADLSLQIGIRILPTWEEAFNGVTTAPASTVTGRGIALLMRRTASTVAEKRVAHLIARASNEQPSEPDQTNGPPTDVADTTLADPPLAEPALSPEGEPPGPLDAEATDPPTDSAPTDQPTDAADTMAVELQPDVADTALADPPLAEPAPSPEDGAADDLDIPAADVLVAEEPPSADDASSEEPEERSLQLGPIPAAKGRRGPAWSLSIAVSESLGLTLTEDAGVWFGSLTGISAVGRLGIVTIGTVRLSLEPQVGYRFEVVSPDEALSGAGSRIIAHTATAALLVEATIGERFRAAAGAQISYPFAGVFVSESVEVPFGGDQRGVIPYAVVRASYRAPWLSRLYLGAQFRFAAGIGLPGVVPLEFGVEFVVGRRWQQAEPQS